MSPLAGVRVLDLTRLLPGAVCTLQLADLGADVVKIEDTGPGDYARTLGVAPGEVSAFYRMVNRNKRSLALDLKDAAGRDAFLRLARQADAIVESFRPGALDNLGVGYEPLHRANPRLVYCAITGYGQTGPRRDEAGHDINYLAYAGVLDQTGVVDGPPALSNLQVADLLGGAADATIGILAALFGAQRTGCGTFIDVSMADGALAYNIFALHALQTHGTTPRRGADLLTGGVPCYGVYRTRDDRYVAVGALEEKFWKKLCERLERPDLIPKRVSTGADGVAAQQALAGIFAAKPLVHWIEHFAHVDCCVTPVLSLDQVLDDPQFQARNMFVKGLDGSTQYAPPIRLTDHEFFMARPAPAQGEHSIEVLREYGFSETEIAALVK